MFEPARGPTNYFGERIKIMWLDATNSWGFVFPLLWPVSIYAWLMLLLSIFIIWLGSKFRLPSTQLYRRLRILFSPKVIPPSPEQLFRDSLKYKKWPY
jgi:hypothetical protein